jgi:hypothetical protein
MYISNIIREPVEKIIIVGYHRCSGSSKLIMDGETVQSVELQVPKNFISSHFSLL